MTIPRMTAAGHMTIRADRGNERLRVPSEPVFGGDTGCGGRLRPVENPGDVVRVPADIGCFCLANDQRLAIDTVRVAG